MFPNPMQSPEKRIINVRPIEVLKLAIGPDFGQCGPEN